MTLAGRRRRVVVREGRVLLLVLLDRTDLEPRLRQPTEVARRRGHRAVDVLARPGHELVLAPRCIARSGLERGAIRLDVVTEARGGGDDPSLVVDARELLEPDAVDLLRVHLEGRPAADRRAVDRVAVGRGPDAGLLAARVPIFAAEHLEVRRVRRIDDVPDDLADALALLVGGTLDAVRDDRGLDRDRQHPLDLRDDPLRDDRWGGQPALERLAQDVGVRSHERRIGV